MSATRARGSVESSVWLGLLTDDVPKQPRKLVCSESASWVAKSGVFSVRLYAAALASSKRAAICADANASQIRSSALSQTLSAVKSQPTKR
jgi:hypothetical protein